MIDLRRILVPTDFSKHSQNALGYAMAFAEKFGAELFLLHIVQDLTPFLPEVEVLPADFPPPVGQLTPAVQKSLQKVIAENHLERLRAHALVREGVPFQEVVRFAREKEIDLIVMGTHGRTGLVHALMGSVTEKVVRYAPCPVLTVRHPEHEFVHP